MHLKKVVKSLATAVFCTSIILTSWGKVSASSIQNYALSDLEYKYDEQDENGIELVKSKTEETKNLISPVGKYNWLGKYIQEEDKNYVTQISDDFSFIKKERLTKEYKVFGIIPAATVAYDNYVYADIPTIDLPRCISVGDNGFSNIETLITANMPMCEQIGEGGFYYCKNLESVETSSKYTNILDNTFYGCEELKNFNNWENIESIGDSAFYNTSFENILLDKCSNIDERAFLDCRKLRSFRANENYTYVKEATFRGCISLMEFGNFENIQKIGTYGFEQTPFESISLPMCKEIGSESFGRCGNLKTIDLPQCEKIGYRAFVHCDMLDSLYLPECKQIGEECFGYKNFSDREGYGCSNLKSIDAPVCEEVGAGAFMYCDKLEEVYLPKCKQISTQAFYNCPALKKIVVAKDCRFEEEAISQDVKIEYVGENTGTYEPDEIDKLTVEVQQPVSEQRAFLEEDDKTGIIVFAEAGVIPSNVHIAVSRLTPKDSDANDENYNRAIENFDENKLTYIENLDLYSINLVDENSNKIQPNGEVTVMVPIKDHFDLTDLEVLRITAMDDEILDTKVLERDGAKYCAFKTNHFSIYCLSDKLTAKEYIDIFAPYVIIFVSILTGIISYQHLKKRKRNINIEE